MRGVSLSLFLGVALAGVPLAPAADGENARTTEVDGTWRLTGYIEDGRPNEDEVRANYRIVRTDGIQEITRAGKFFNKRVFKVDPRKMPRHIDFIDDKGAVVRGVYEIAGDAMRIAILADPERQRTDRPDDLGKEGKIVAVYERVRDRALDSPGKNDAPQSLEEGRVRLERLLGRFHQEDNRQRRFIYDDEIQTSPEPGKPIVIVREGVMTYGVPVRAGDLITFDVITSLRRTIYDVGDGGKRRLSREIQNHTALRYHLRRSLSNDWFYDAVFLSHSIPEFHGRPQEIGRINWLPDGIEFVGTGTDNFFRQGGVLAPAAYLTSRRITSDRSRLVEATRNQSYELARGPDGNILPIPDFSRPFGQPFISEIGTEPAGHD